MGPAQAQVGAIIEVSSHQTIVCVCVRVHVLYLGSASMLQPME